MAKQEGFQRRFYRDWVGAKGLHLMHIIAKETDLQVLTNKPVDKDFIEEKIRSYRWDIENYINKDRRFLTTLKPLSVEIGAPSIIRDMAEQSKKANVGPMATVAGAISESLGMELLQAGYRDIIIENGGDIFIRSVKSRVVGIYSGRSKLWRGLGLKIKAKDTPVGICTSSGTVGHSLSFGSADSVVILSKSSALADAVATATCNRVKSKSDLQPALEFAKSVKGILGVVIIMKNNLISWGKVEFCRTV
ncbi:MAG TPA: UPF0280 family protein [Candidatus Margulisiibacteriota bacterium]|nr:UPF0280 family protein [Candidatus Margulisiibacteriota bacterium]